jgi:CelD/BcsL family acetyltransferase involved in cellulose biosynthesis
MEIICDTAGLNALEREWNELYAESPKAVPPLSWDWVSGWWRHYGEAYGCKGAGLRVICIRRGARLIGVLPLYLGRLGPQFLGLRRLGFISTGEAQFEETCPVYLDILHAANEELACHALVHRALGEAQELSCDELHLRDVSAHSSLIRIGASLRGGGKSVQVRPGGESSSADTTGGFEEYLKRLSSTNRREARRMLRDAREAGASFELARPDQVDPFFDQLLVLHEQRWASVGDAGAFAPRHAAFHRELLHRLVPRGEAILARLTHDGRPLAVLCGYSARETLHCYQQGVDRSAGPLRSPGTTAWLMLMRHLEAQGVTRFDHQKVKTAFKQRFCPVAHPLVRLRIIRSTPRALTYEIADLAQRGVRKGYRLLSGVLQGANGNRSAWISASGAVLTALA